MRQAIAGVISSHGAVLTRLGSGILAIGIGSVFTLASLLVPAAEGHGTHMQLGLGNCSFLALTGYPCPMCGATTTWTLMAHLRPLQALVNQPFAAMLFMMAAGTLGVAVAEVVDPRNRWMRISRWLEPREGWLATLFLAAMGVAWIYKAILMAGT